jgi:hypothetical protein
MFRRLHHKEARISRPLVHRQAPLLRWRGGLPKVSR